MKQLGIDSILFVPECLLNAGTQKPYCDLDLGRPRTYTDSSAPGGQTENNKSEDGQKDGDSGEDEIRYIPRK